MTTLAPLLALALAAPGAGPFVVEATGQRFARLQAAVDAAGARSEATGRIVVVRIENGVHRQCAVQTKGAVEYRAENAGRAVLEGTPCEGKAALVLRGQGAVVDGLTFRGLRVPDANGSGIRWEAGSLAVANARFEDSEQGILSGDIADGELTIEGSTFSGLGRCDRGLACAHSVYTGAVRSVTVERARFERGNGGHYLKTRSGRVRVADSTFDDSRGRTTNYMIDLSAGATGRISGNLFVQGRDKENYSAFITVAPEGRANPSRGLAIEGNEAALVPGLSRSTAFVADWSGEALAIGANKLGAGIKRFERR